MNCLIPTKKGKPCKKKAIYGFGEPQFCSWHEKYMAVFR